ncbi:MAG TPA: hypothetical protein VNH45_05170 [Gaiellaceae bacterium]|nr:hypothetical protein [Gaiellaceae bacterium]
MKTSIIVLLLAGITLAAPASAAAHGRSQTIALDYRLVLDRATRSLHGVSVAILDGDRSVRVSTHGVTVVVRGDLGEPMLRIGPSGVWVNRASVTAVANRLTSLSHDWKRVASGHSYAWHEHRLAPPPYGSKVGPVARFAMPATIDGHAVTIGGTFVRYRRPAVWPWLVGAAVFAAAIWAATRHGWRVTVVLGALAGVATLASRVSFSAAAALNGRVAWPQIGLWLALGGVGCFGLIRTRGQDRVLVAGLLGCVTAVLSLGSLGVFWHGVVLSEFSATFTRVLIAVALIAGAAAAATLPGGFRK